MANRSYKELKTIRDLIRYAVSCFNQADLSFGHGNDNAWDEAVYLVLERLNLPLDQLTPYIDARVLDSERKLVLDLIHQRAATRLPLAHLIGVAWLQGHRFLTDKRVFIPRSPIAKLITQEELHPWIQDSEAPVSLLNMCSGSGSLAILMALTFPNSTVDAVDVSEYATLLTQRNVAMYKLEDRINIIESDLFKDLNKEQSYDVIICNPPYVTTESLRRLPDEYRHEPSIALHGGDDGMEIIRKFLSQAVNYLNEDGFIILEIGFNKNNFHQAFPNLEPIFLENEYDSNIIILLTKDQLKNYQGLN
ncbi:MAG: 50S ribosomal protein L3 N(5)-glutamine methyltransferase [Alcaligenaceae bacterium]|jgi:ribosomal protein L3 glutamine methyltransferase|nr:50S ribosomal protein L3 N(5)-glutamine methyltransferase [Alcaligenaceae bacterium]